MGANLLTDDLLREADRVPGLGERVVRFIKLEVARDEIRQKRFRPETLALIASAQSKAQDMRRAGFHPDEEKAAFLRRLDKMTMPEAP